MKIVEENIQILKTARYYVIGSESSDIKSLYIVIHGYAQLAADFIKEFEFLAGKKALIAAPEGLSKFYFRYKIGASWMTKEDRANEIKDYLIYLDLLFIELKNKFKNISEAKINIIGFSQGVHTAVRWFCHTKNHIDNLILCSSDFPKDADFITLKEKLFLAQMYFIYGKQDDVIGQDTYRKSIELLKEKKIKHKEITFDQGHVIDQATLKKFIK
ncbi:MAG: hypothetical protein ABI792_05600 [bacterium]